MIGKPRNASPTADSARPKSVSARRDVPWLSGFYVLALVVCSAALIGPVWIGAIPPLQDFGGHVILTDAWVHLAENPVYGEFYVATDTISNVLPALFVSLCEPALDTIAALRLFTTLCLVATVLSLVVFLRVFERSRWLVFLALPFMWGSTLSLGLINFMGILPLMFFAAAAARRGGLTGRWPYALALALLTVLAALMHGMGYVFVAGLGLGPLAISLTRWRHLWQLLAFLPSIALWWSWFQQKLSESALPGDSVPGMFEYATYFTPEELVVWFVKESLNVVGSQADTATSWLLFGIWLLFMGLSVGRSGPDGPASAAEPAAEAPGSRWRRAVGQLRAWPVAAYAELREHPVLLMAIALGCAYYFFPSFLRETSVNQRFITPWIFTLAMLPRLPRRGLLATAGVLTTIGACLGFAWLMRSSLEAFERRETATLEQLVSQIPAGARVDCLAIDERVIHRWSLLHNCPGLVAARTGGYTGGGFANTAYNAVQQRPGSALSRLDQGSWYRSPHLTQWDYVLVRGGPFDPPARRARLVAAVPPSEDGAAEWRLYKVVARPRSRASADGPAGPDAGVSDGD